MTFFLNNNAGPPQQLVTDWLQALDEFESWFVKLEGCIQEYHLVGPHPANALPSSHSSTASLSELIRLREETISFLSELQQRSCSPDGLSTQLVAEHLRLIIDHTDHIKRFCR